MGKSETLKLLNQLLDKIPQLKQLNEGNQKYRLWYDEARDTLESLFGRDSVEYKRFTVKIRIYKRGASEAEKQERYLKQLEEHETDLRSIIRRQEIKKTADSTTEAVSAAPKVFVADNGEKRPFEKAWEIEIEGDVQTLYPIIQRVADELNIENYLLEARPANSKETPTSAWFNIFSISRTTASSTLIGVLTLESFGSNRTILRVPPRSQWYKGGLSPDETIKMGLTEADKDTIVFYDGHFRQFIERLDTVFKHYGSKVTWYKRLWRGFKEIIGIYKAVKP
jgi:hypothetical protein